MKIVVTLTKAFIIDLETDLERRGEIEEILKEMFEDEAGKQIATSEDISDAIRERISADLDEGLTEFVDLNSISMRDIAVAVPQDATIELNLPEYEDEIDDVESTECAVDQTKVR